jgi:hypothetical protein
MRKISNLLLIALLAIVGVGCDSNSDPKDADRLVGTWALTGASDSQGDQIAAFAAAFSSVTLTNLSDGNFTINVVPVEGAAQAISGTYTVVEATKTLTLRASVGGQTVPLIFTYTIASDTQVSLKSDTTTAVLLNNLFGTTLQGQVTISVTKVS